MDNITPELRRKFLRFREVYEFTLEKLQLEGASGSVVAVKVWEAAQQEVPLTAEELRIYKMHVALHSVNGGELFAIEREKKSDKTHHSPAIPPTGFVNEFCRRILTNIRRQSSVRHKRSSVPGDRVGLA